MSVLLLRLAGPLQSWGDSSRFTRRQTRPEPTKSGVLGLIAAAQGRRRTDPIEDLVGLKFGVRVDQPGRLIRDFQTAQSATKSMPLSYRYYLGDAVFVAGIEGERTLLEGIVEAIDSPEFPLYLGRRSCPPAGKITIGVRAEDDLDAAMRQEAWHAAPWHRKSVRAAEAQLAYFRDAHSAEEPGETVRDLPISFDQERREYGWRTVVQDRPIAVDNPDFRGSTSAAGARRSGPEGGAPREHDVMAAVEGF